MRKEFFGVKIRENILGFTMVELLVSFSILGLLVVAVTPLFKQGTEFWLTTQSQVELRQNLNSAIQLINKELRQSDPNPTVIANDKIIYQITKNGSTDSKIIAWDMTSSPRRLTLTTVGGDTIAITSETLIDIEQFAPSYDSGLGSYQVVVTGKNVDSTNSLTLQTKVFRRTDD